MKKGILSVIIVGIIVFTIITISFAATYSIKITLKDVTSADVEQGKTITFLIKLSDIDAENGIGAISGKFEYDTNVFEKIEAADVKACSGWGTISYNDQNDDEGRFVTERAAGDTVTENNDLMEITATVKLNAPTGRTEIKISNITASDGNEDITIADVKAAIAIVGDNPSNNNNTNTNNNTNMMNNSNTNNTTPTNNTNGVGNNNNNALPTNTIGNNITANGTIPNTGIVDYTMPFILILLAVAVISYIRYKKIKNI